MNLSEKIEYLRKNPVFFSRLGFGFDPPRLDENGKWILFNRNFKKYQEIHKEFYDANVKIHSTGIPNGWIGVDKYDYTCVDEVLDCLFSELPDIYYLPRIKLNVPVDWCYENPTETFVYANGPRDEKGIRDLVGTLKHDFFGYDNPDGYSVNGGTYKDTRPNVGGLIGMQSFSSEKWLHDAGVALENIINYLEKGKYGDRIIGYHIAYGNCGETTLWGSWDPNIYKKGDFGISASKNFTQNFSNGKYSSVPSVEHMYSRKDTLEGFFRSEKDDEICVDYAKFLNEANAKAIKYFCKVAKKAAPDKVAGAFFGYIVNVPYSSYSGHLDFDDVLSDENVDFLSSPKGYYRCDPCGGGVEQAVSNSIALKKLWLDEVDNLTHIDIRNYDTKAKDYAQTKAVLEREFTKNISHNQGYWWMDLGEYAFHDKQIMEDIDNMTKLSHDMDKHCESKSETDVLFVMDEKSLYHTVPSISYHRNFIQEISNNFKQCGILNDFYRFDDLKDIDLSKYKAILFLNQFYMPQERLKVLERIPKDTVKIWCYCPGIISEKFDIENVKKLTGIGVEPYKGDAGKIELPGILVPDECKNDFPFVNIIEENGIEVIKRYDDGKAMIAKKDNDILISCPIVSIEDAYAMLKMTKAHLYTDANFTVCGDNRFIFVIAKNDSSTVLSLKEKKNLIDVDTNEKYENTDKIRVELKAGNAKLFRYLI